MFGMKNHFDISGSIEIHEVDIAGVLRSDKDESHQQHRLGMVNKNITRGLKPVLRDPILALGLRVVHTHCWR